MKKIDRTGCVFGRWTVLGDAPKAYTTMWRCRCVCGAERVVSGANLASGHSTSCGCYREENRPKLSVNRDYTGGKNPKAKRAKAQHGTDYIPSDDVWYKRAGGVWYAAKRKGTPLGFASTHELATYAKSLATDRCPVFDVPYVDRGSGFSKWSPSIDKIDPTKGYVRGNIQIVSMLANCMKRDATAAELRTFAEWVLKGEKTV